MTFDARLLRGSAEFHPIAWDAWLDGQTERHFGRQGMTGHRQGGAAGAVACDRPGPDPKAPRPFTS
jgi:hypothetical protein